MDDFDIFHNAPENATREELAAYLDEACGDDAELRARVEELCVMQSRTDDFLEDAPLDLDAPTIGPGGQSSGKASPTPTPSTSGVAAADSFTEQAGDTIGPFTLLEKLGEGGFGTVWKAEQSVPFVRTVALKIIKRGMDTEEVITRFEAERQALAVMDHPNIAKVHDAGTTETGRPYFVMELVDGTPLTQYCDDQKLNLHDRLELFTQVCAGVQHAHQKGIIHRDLKPPNVLVVEHDGKPVPKVIDFGIAKAIGQELTGKTLETMAGQIIGTPVYMSPEQASGVVSADIDTRSDVYSLGVILYELLSGRLPFEPKELMKAGLGEMERIIREVEPPKLSTRIGKLTDADQTTIALARDTQPGKLARFVRGDLEWVVMKALSKERERRYETPTAFAKDVQHYLHHEPVEAGPPSAIYRMKRYARKHRRPLAAAALFITGLLALTTWALSERDHAREERESLAKERERALHLARHLRTDTIVQILDGYGAVALQVTSITKAREMLESYNRGEISRGEFSERTQSFLGDALASSDAMAGIARLDHKGDLAASVGLPIPQQYWVIPPPESRSTTLLGGPVEHDEKRLLIIGAPILNRESERVGTDIVAVRMERLQKVVYDYTGFGETGQLILGSINKNGRPYSLFPLRSGGELSETLAGVAMEKAIQGQEGIIADKDAAVAYGPVSQSPNWGVVLTMDHLGLVR